MRKKITSLGFGLLMMLGLSTTNAETYKWSIEEGETLSSFSEVSVTVEGATTVEEYYYLRVQLNRAGTTEALASAYGDFDTTTNTATFKIPDYYLWPDYPLTQDGDYTITLADGAFLVDGVESAKQVLNFKIDSPDQYVNLSDVTVDPASCNIEELFDKVTLTLPEKVTSVTFNEVDGDSYGNTKLTAKAQFIISGYSYGELDMTAEGNVVTLTPTEALKKVQRRAGNWYIRVLPGSMTFNGDAANTHSTWLIGPYTMPQFENLEITPESGNIVSLNKFTVKFSTWEATVEASDDESLCPALYYYNENLSTYEFAANFNVEIVAGEEPVAVLTLDETATASLPLGKYKVVVPKGAYTVTDPYNGNEYISAALEAEYTLIEKPNVSTVPTWSIEENAVLPEFSEVTMTFAEATEISYIGEYSYPYISVNKVNDDGSLTPWPNDSSSGTLSVTIDGQKVLLYMNEYSFEPDYPIDVDGTYRVVVPAGKFAFEGIDSFTNDELTLTFQVDAVDPVITMTNTTIDPAPCELTAPLQEVFTITINDFEGEITLQNEITEEYVWNEETEGYDIIEVEAPYQAQLRCDIGYFEMEAGRFDITVNGNVLTLTADPSAVSEDQYYYPGDYYIQIPKKALIVDGDENKFNEQLRYGAYPVVYRSEGVVTSPEPGTEVEELSTFVVEYPDEWRTAQMPTENAAVAKVYVYDEAASEYVEKADLTVTLGLNEDENPMAELTLAEPITESGKYKLVIPRHTVEFYDESEGKTVENELLEAEYTIVAAEVPVVLIATPADGETVDKIVNISLEWQGATTVELDNTMMIGGAKLYKDGSEEAYSDMICSPLGTGTIAYLDALTYATENGDYTIEIAEGMFTVDGQPWEAITLHYTIAGKEVTLTDIGETPLAKLEMNVTPCETVEVNSGASGNVTLAYLVNGITEVGTYEVEVKDAAKAELTLSTNAELQNGDYVVWIPEGYFLFDGEECADIKIYFDGVEFSGVADINLDATDLNIYSVNGMLIKRNGSVSDLNSLDSGIYIVNGKKVLINKK